MKSLFFFILTLGFTSASSINVFKTSKFEIPPTTTQKTVKEEPDQFKPNMHLARISYCHLMVIALL